MLTIKEKRSKNYIGTVDSEDTLSMIKQLIYDANKFFSDKPYRYTVRRKESDIYLYRKVKQNVTEKENS